MCIQHILDNVSNPPLMCRTIRISTLNNARQRECICYQLLENLTVAPIYILKHSSEHDMVDRGAVFQQTSIAHRDIIHSRTFTTPHPIAPWKMISYGVENNRHFIKLDKIFFDRL